MQFEHYDNCKTLQLYMIIKRQSCSDAVSTHAALAKDKIKTKYDRERQQRSLRPVSRITKNRRFPINWK